MTKKSPLGILASQHPAHCSLLSNDEAALYLGVTPRTLEVWRSTKRHCIPYIKVGRLVKYRITVLDTFLTTQTVCDVKGSQ
jgi:excisionase family DNA binding protein